MKQFLRALPLALNLLMGTFSTAFAGDDADYEYPAEPPATPYQILTDNGKPVLRLFGERMSLAGGKVETWLNISPSGLQKVGLTLSPEVLDQNQLPTAGSHHGSHMRFPQVPGSPFIHAFFAWNPNGHPPVTIYNVPHYDFHLAFVEPDDLMAITAGDPRGQILPAAKFMPTTAVPQRFPDGSYVNVPGQGVHWYYEDASEWNGGAYTETFLWGSFNGKNIFMEPMFTYNAMVYTPRYERQIQLPACVHKTAFYPTIYGWEHKRDSAGRTYIEMYMRQFVLKRARSSECR